MRAEVQQPHSQSEAGRIETCELSAGGEQRTEEALPESGSDAIDEDPNLDTRPGALGEQVADAAPRCVVLPDVELEVRMMTSLGNCPLDGGESLGARAVEDERAGGRERHLIEARGEAHLTGDVVGNRGSPRCSGERSRESRFQVLVAQALAEHSSRADQQINGQADERKEGERHDPGESGGGRPAVGGDPGRDARDPGELEQGNNPPFHARSLDHSVGIVLERRSETTT